MKEPPLILLDATLPLLDAALESSASLAASLGAEVAHGWEGFPEALPRLRATLADSHQTRWGTVFFLLPEPRTLVGVGGYKGEPSAQGVVEIGYAIAPALQNRGLATQAAAALVARARDELRVTAVDARTLGCQSPSTRVLEKLGFRRIAEETSKDHGPIWHWRLQLS